MKRKVPDAEPRFEIWRTDGEGPRTYWMEPAAGRQNIPGWQIRICSMKSTRQQAQAVLEMLRS